METHDIIVQKALWDWIDRYTLLILCVKQTTGCVSRSVMSDSSRPHGLQPARLLCPWGFSRQEYWSDLPCPPPGDLHNPGNWTGISSTKGFPCGSASKEFACNAGDLDLIPGLGRPPGEGKGYPHQYSGLENSMNSLRVRHDWATFTFTPALQADSLPFEPPNGGL